MPFLSSEDQLHLGLLRTFLLENHRADLEAVLAADDDRKHYSIYAGCMALLDASVEFGEALINDPVRMLDLMDMAAVFAEQEVYDEAEAKEKLCMKHHLHMRLINVPQFIQTTSLPRCANVGKFQAITGTILRVTSAKVLEHQKEYTCTKCGYIVTVDADIQMYHSHVLPSNCPSECGCNGTRFTLTSPGTNISHCRDYQEVLLQEKVNNLVVGIIPGHMWVILEDDLVDTCKPGQDVVISGVVLVRQRKFSRSQRPDSGFVFRAHNVEVSQAECTSAEVSAELRKEFEEFWQSNSHSPLQGRNMILCSVCPQVYGLFLVKLAVALVLAGGVHHSTEDGTKIRGESHLLLVGDPGTAKSQFLKYAAKMSARSVLTTGIGSTSAGLTAAAVKEGGEWQLEAGALVLADGGICCIDEFNGIREHDRGSIHEAMEQQTLSVAKAGLVSKLSTRCSILAATNPKGSCSASGELDVNIGIASPLLSRFDLVLVLRDTHNEDWDRLVSSFLLSGRDPLQEHSNDGFWTISKMRAYFAVVRMLNPVMTCDAKSVLQEYYQCQRRASERSAARTTLRLLESLIRLSQAHARIMFREEATVQDAVVAIMLMESSMQRSALVRNVDALHTGFPKDPELDYRNQARLILTQLGLGNVLRREMERCQTQSPPSSPGLGKKTLQNARSHQNSESTENSKRISSPPSPPSTRQRNKPTGNVPLRRVREDSRTEKEVQRLGENAAVKRSDTRRSASPSCGLVTRSGSSNTTAPLPETANSLVVDVHSQLEHQTQIAQNDVQRLRENTAETRGAQKLISARDDRTNHGNDNGTSPHSTKTPEDDDGNSKDGPRSILKPSHSDDVSTKPGPMSTSPEGRSTSLKAMLKSFAFKRTLPAHVRFEKQDRGISKDGCPKESSDDTPTFAAAPQKQCSDRTDKEEGSVAVCDSAATRPRASKAAEKLKKFACVPREPTCKAGSVAESAARADSSCSSSTDNIDSSVSKSAKVSLPGSQKRKILDIGRALSGEAQKFDDTDWDFDLSTPVKLLKTTK